MNENRIVFVVHGRDAALSAALFRFLRAVGLQPLEWAQAVALTGDAAPYIGEVLDAALAHAQAIVVLLSPDDEARLRSAFLRPEDGAHERELTGQARPNVLFEAGMALGRAPARTVLVQCGEVRPFSDIAGRHVVRLGNSGESRQALAQRLRVAGCPCDLTGSDWLREGDFGAPPSVARGSAERPTTSSAMSVVIHKFSRNGSYFGIGSHLAIDPGKATGHGLLTIDRKGLVIERSDTVGSYLVEILSYDLGGKKCPFIPAVAGSQATNVLRVRCEADLEVGRCYLKFATADYARKQVIDHRFVEIRSQQPARVDVLVTAPASVACYVQIHQFELSEPTWLVLKKLTVDLIGDVAMGAESDELIQ